MEAMEEEAPAAMPMPASPPSPDAPRGGGGRARKVATSSLGFLMGDGDDFASQVAQARKQAQQLDAGAVVQTGPGVPDWSWQRFRIGLTLTGTPASAARPEAAGSRRPAS